MCGRFVSARKRLELLEEFAATRDAVAGTTAGTGAENTEADNIAADSDKTDETPAAARFPDYNVAPTKRIYTVLAHKHKDGDGDGSERELRLVRWGLVPGWAKDTAGGSRLINARAETVAVKPSFRAAFAKRRCLIPADGYYEWMNTETDGKKTKQPYYIHRADNGILAFAGLYELWRNKELPDDHQDAWYWSATIITTDATDEIGRIHDRTPMIIKPENWTDWLDPGNSERDLLLATMLPATSSPGGGLTSYKVGPAVGAVRNNGPGLIEPLGDQERSALF
jgi:putative SOS response-associated peptidase YedK